jgi:glutathione synthase/RimK-type ligase-like ATP-grasp enzyme
MRALVIGSNAPLALSVVSALGAAHAEADVWSDWYVPRLRFSRYCRNYVRVPYAALDLSQSTQLIKQYCVDNAIDLVIPADLRTALGLASLEQGELPRFPVASPSVLEELHDKWMFYQLLTREQLPSPRTELLTSEAPQAVDLPYPIILKPAAGEGGEGIFTAETPEELTQLWAAQQLGGGRYLAQELIIGYDVDVSVLAEHGRVVAHTVQYTEAPDTMRFMHSERMLEVAKRIVDVSCFHGLAHFDMRIDARDGSLYVLECNPRVWGSLMYSVWAGVNFIELGCEIALGRRPRASVPPSERVWHQGVAPRRLLKALLQGRRAPAGMRGATLASWQQAHDDPWTQVIGKLTEAGESKLRHKLQSRAKP